MGALSPLSAIFAVPFKRNLHFERTIFRSSHREKVFGIVGRVHPGPVHEYGDRDNSSERQTGC